MMMMTMMMMMMMKTTTVMQKMNKMLTQYKFKFRRTKVL